MAAGRNTQFLKSVRENELLEPVQLKELEQSPQAQGDDLPALGKLILQKGWLTRFQINLVAQGKAKDLLLGPYRLLDRLGEGGMGQVFKAHHHPMNRIVALKVIRKEKLASQQAVQRFFREVQAAAKLVHPHIVLAFDAGQVEKTYYFAMEYVEGIDLAKLVVQNGPLPEKAACDYIRQAALGLAHAHEQGMIHRDIKPHNLLVTKVSDTSSSRSSAGSASKPAVKDVVKILDMGLARLQSTTPTDHSLTQEGAVVGTPDYIAPEQALDARRVDGRSDLYSLGGVFFYLLTGRPPFSGGTLAELLLKHQMEAPPDVRQLRPEISADAAAIVAHLLAKRPEDRFQSPLELTQALEPLIQGGGSPLAWSRAAEPNAFSDLGGSIDTPSSATLAQPRLAARVKPAEPMSGKKLLIGGGTAAAVLLLGLLVFLLIPKGQGDGPAQRDDKRIANAPTEKSLPPTAAGEPPAMADFTLAPVGPLTIKGGENKSLQIKVERKGLGGKPIQVRLAGLPAGVRGDAAVIDGVQDTVQINLDAQANVGDVQKDVQVVASSGTVEKKLDFKLTVQRAAAVVVRPPNYNRPNVHRTVGEDVPALPDGGGKYRFVEPDGRLLGLEYHLGEWAREKCVGGLVPVFSIDQPSSKPSRVVARPGYAVAGAEVNLGKYVDGIRLLFRRVKPDGNFDADDAYKGEWIGYPPTGEAKTLVNDGRRVIGIHIQRIAIVDRFALVVEK